MIVVFALLMPGVMLGVTMLLWHMENRLLGEPLPDPLLIPVLVPEMEASAAGGPAASAAPRQRSHAPRSSGVVSAA